MQAQLSSSIKLNIHRLTIHGICYAYILLFLYAASYKLMDYDFFERQLRFSPLLGNFSRFLAWAVPLAEILAALMLIVPRFRYRGLWLSGLILAVFTIYIIYILGFSGNIPCGCGGILASMGWKEHLIFNSVFVALAALAIFIYPSKLKMYIH
jgi:uncharacterized membrane protein YphA (DoxX/SURF4 family)